MKDERSAHAAQHGRGMAETGLKAAAAQAPDDECERGKDIADLIGAAGQKGQRSTQHSPAAVAGRFPREKAEPCRHGPEQRPLRHGVVAVHALVPDGGCRQRQRKAGQRQCITAAEPPYHAADQKGRRTGKGDDIQPVAAQTAIEQQRHGVGVVKGEKARLLQGEIPQTALQILQKKLRVGHTVQIKQPFVQRQLVIALGRDADRNAQIQHTHGKNQKIGCRHKQAAVAPAESSDLFHKGRVLLARKKSHIYSSIA